MPRASDPLACLLYILARNTVPWGQLEAALEKALSDVTPELPADDPVVVWAQQAAENLRQK